MPEPGYIKRRYRWSKEEVLEKMREWERIYGQPPMANDWQPSDCLSAAERSAMRSAAWAERAARFYAGEWPWVGTVSKLFGRWNAALEEAGLEVRWQTKAPCVLPGTDVTAQSLRLDVDRIVKAANNGDYHELRSRLTVLAVNALALARSMETS